MSIEKFHGTFSKEDGGVTIAMSKTIQAIKDFSTLGLYIYLCSKPHTWAPNVKELMRQGGCGRDKVYRMLNDLIGIGLIGVKTERDQGKYSKTHYTVYLHLPSATPEPCPEDQEMDDLPLPENPDTANQHAYKEKKEKNKDLKKEKNIIKKEKSLSPVSYPETLYPMPATVKAPVTPSRKLDLPDLVSDNPHSIPSSMIEDWLSIRNAKKNTHVTPTAWKKLNTELHKLSNPIEAFEVMVTNGWMSINANWINNKKEQKESFYDNVSYPRINRERLLG